MTTRHLLPIAIAGIFATWIGASAAQGQHAGTSGVARPQFSLPSFLIPRILRSPAPKPSDSKPSDPPAIAFFIADGPADACGPGCDTWIAAEGRIDLYAAQRLRKVLARLGPRKLPLFLHSAGGSVLGAIELGRLIRRNGIAVSVARTTPVECSREKTCETLKRSGQDLASEFDSTSAICNSACVLVLAGGAQRSVPPWVRLGVHAIGIDSGKTVMRGAVVAAATRSANARIVEYLHDMGIPKALFDASDAIPHESTRFLERDELVLYGLDIREFGETNWRFAEKPNAAITKGFFVHTAESGVSYPEALMRLSCGAGKMMRLTYARERATSATGNARDVRLAVNGLRIDLPDATRSGKVEVRTASLSPDAIASLTDGSAIELSGFDGAGNGKPPADEPRESTSKDGKPRSRIVLSMAGFSAAYARLRKVCGDIASAETACGGLGDTSSRCTPEQPKTPVSPTASGKVARPAQ